MTTSTSSCTATAVSLDGGTGLAGVVSRVDELLSRAVRLASDASGGEPCADPLRALFVSDADAGRLTRRGLEPLGTRLGLERPLVDVQLAGSAWRRFASVFKLTHAEVDLLALALVPELDLRYERIFGYLHDDITKRRLTVDLACQLLCESFSERLTARRLFVPDATLRRYGLIHLLPDPAQVQAPMIAHAIRLDDGIIEMLVGDEGIDRRLADAARLDETAVGTLPPEVARIVGLVLQSVRRSSATARHYALLGGEGALKVQVARHLARELEQPLFVVDMSRLMRLEVGFVDAVLLATRSAHLRGALTLWTGADHLVTDSDAESTARLEHWLGVLDAFGVTGTLLAITEPAYGGALIDRFLAVQLPPSDAASREQTWRQRLAAHGAEIEADDTRLLGEVFTIDSAAIDRAVDSALASAHWSNPESSELRTEDLVASARLQVLRALPRYATRVEGAPGWDDIVLPSDQLRQLHELENRVRHRYTVLNKWGFARRLTLGSGVAALFSGPSGTGKTMAAQVIGTALGMDLYRIEIPAIVSKYIGDTEKALEQLFREARGTSVILFFDEADALFGKRSEVKDAHDRYANIEISYLLQAIEHYDGLTILATNLRQNLDEAFVRRLAFSVTFPFPEEAERRRIWGKCWPEQVPLSGDIDLDFLARQFKLTGGNIRNVALAAAFEAASEDTSVGMSQVVRGVRREFQKMGKTCVESDFGPWFGALDDAGEHA